MQRVLVRNAYQQNTVYYCTMVSLVHSKVPMRSACIEDELNGNFSGRK